MVDINISSTNGALYPRGLTACGRGRCDVTGLRWWRHGYVVVELDRQWSSWHHALDAVVVTAIHCTTKTHRQTYRHTDVQTDKHRPTASNTASRISRDQPNSREKKHDFTAEFLKCVKFHGKFTERVSQIHGKFTGHTDVTLRCCANANEEISERRICTTLSQDSRQSMSTTLCWSATRSKQQHPHKSCW